MDEDAADIGNTTGEHEPEQEGDADADRRELAILLNEIDERLADEAGYGYGV